MCNACYSDTKTNAKTKSKTTFTAEYKECIIVIKNVPCLECEICGEITFPDEVSANIEMIVDAAKKLIPEVLVIDYNDAVGHLLS